MCTSSALNPSGLLGAGATYIKATGGGFAAIEGANTLESIDMSLLRMPYVQYFKTRMFLQPGAVNQPVNYANLGNNVTFIALSVYYDAKAKIEENNYILYSFVTDPATTFPVAQELVLTGNSTHRIPEIFLSNPSTLYAVKVEMLVACIDQNQAFFNNTNLPNNANFTISNLEFSDIHTHLINQSIKVLNTAGQPVLYMQIVDIAMIERSGHVLIIDDNAIGRVYLDFVNDYNALQALSALSWLLEVPVTRTLPQVADNTAPVVTFTLNVVANAASATLFAYSGTITKTNLLTFLLSTIVDNRDGNIIYNPNDIQIEQATIPFSTITTPGVYNIIFNVKDIADNSNLQVIILTVS